MPCFVRSKVVETSVPTDMCKTGFLIMVFPPEGYGVPEEDSDSELSVPAVRRLSDA